jgi:hypothetical protein
MNSSIVIFASYGYLHNLNKIKEKFKKKFFYLGLD